jgi:hypothetical protein
MENIKVCVRVRPQVREEDNPSNPLWLIEGNSLINAKTKDIFSYGNI